MELARAMSASSKSSLFALSKSDVIYQDQWLIAVNKPQGVYCESVLNSVPQVLDCLVESSELSEGTVARPELHLANRLDRDTSGVMIITKLHKLRKWEKIAIKSGHGRSKFGAFRVYAASDVGRSLPGGSTVKDMETSFEVLSINGQGSFKEPSEFNNDKDILVVEEKAVIDADAKKDEILVRAFPRSGRTHQIRLHCQYLGIPIRGDVKYEGVCEWKGTTYDSHELHAESLSLEHPVTGQPLMFRAPLPLWVTQMV
ncbi:hypothetical protein OIU85_005172 [Salix viminalis]|uniref:Pseudouridine synthase RsuA/RluA-like domain-containing protein n=1 Tax=Salix viminalis TaxID=40686 RepID=A0A9Q0SZ47_SALVM|nr:hypothetical protein OIU85_005172 [Salix viminalis]